MTDQIERLERQLAEAKRALARSTMTPSEQQAEQLGVPPKEPADARKRGGTASQRQADRLLGVEDDE